MANMIDYLAWRGEFPFEVTPWNDVDALLMATLSYLNFHGMQDARGWTLSEAQRIDLLQDDSAKSAAFENRRKMFVAMAESVRFAGSRIHHFFAVTDHEQNMQFSAMCIDVPDGSMCVAFRGTDNTIVGWREDFDMAYRTIVPGQEAAACYLAQAVERADRPVRVVGHSKGGNLGVYAAALASPALQDKIVEIVSFDGPGMNREMSVYPGYLNIKPKIRSYIPQSSIIGLLMEYYEPYTVVRSTASGIMQHDPMSWQVYGPRFEETASIDQLATVVRDTLHEWLESSTPEQRGDFVDALFQMVDTTKATRFSDLSGEKLKTLITMISTRRELTPESRKTFDRLMGQAVALGLGNVVDLGKNIVLKRAEESRLKANTAAGTAAQQAADTPETRDAADAGTKEEEPAE